MAKKPADADKCGYRDDKGRFIQGNPGGELKKGSISLTAIVKRKLKELSPDGKREAVEVLSDNIIQDALDGKSIERKLIWNYVDGMPQEKIEMTGLEGGPIEIDIKLKEAINKIYGPKE